MRLLLGIFGLLLTVAIVGVIVKQQLRATHAPPIAGAADAGASAVPPAVQARQIEKQVADDVQKALQQGAARASEAER